MSSFRRFFRRIKSVNNADDVTELSRVNNRESSGGSTSRTRPDERDPNELIAGPPYGGWGSLPQTPSSNRTPQGLSKSGGASYSNRTPPSPSLGQQSSNRSDHLRHRATESPGVPRRQVLYGPPQSLLPESSFRGNQSGSDSDGKQKHSLGAQQSFRNEGEHANSRVARVEQLEDPSSPIFIPEGPSRRLRDRRLASNSAPSAPVPVLEGNSWPRPRKTFPQENLSIEENSRRLGEITDNLYLQPPRPAASQEGSLEQSHSHGQESTTPILGPLRGRQESPHTTTPEQDREVARRQRKVHLAEQSPRPGWKQYQSNSDIPAWKQHSQPLAPVRPPPLAPFQSARSNEHLYGQYPAPRQNQRLLLEAVSSEIGRPRHLPRRPNLQQSVSSPPLESQSGVASYYRPAQNSVVCDINSPRPRSIEPSTHVPNKVARRLAQQYHPDIPRPKLSNHLFDPLEPKQYFPNISRSKSPDHFSAQSQQCPPDIPRSRSPNHFHFQECQPHLPDILRPSPPALNRLFGPQDSQPPTPARPRRRVVPRILPTKQSSFEDISRGSETHEVEMESLQVRPANISTSKAKAIEDAKQMQNAVIAEANKEGKQPPKYVLMELIGKGSFGRVYKSKDLSSAQFVAVKIIDIDESDTINRNMDSYAEFMKEINALQILSGNKARNINHVIEALPVGQAMWMVTEYCGGGSIQTLMKPTAPGGLQEKWIIPVLREVAEAIKAVHEAGIIHRDIKCANVLITEQGGVQLCDFGVAGIVETKIDKRSTIVGTPHWMAPELFSNSANYGKEVDIWAFGAMTYELATGLPPNVANNITSIEALGTALKQHVPRLGGGDYSKELRGIVAYCLQELPSSRPTIEEVQKHPFIHNTSARYPTSSLSHLVRAFKLWEDHGGSRKSLFMMRGAQGPSELASTAMAPDEWNFHTTAAFDQEVRRQSTAQEFYDAYGTTMDLQNNFSEETARPNPTPKPSRRRPPPEALAPLRAPLEKLFDPNTMSSYEDNSRSHYGRPPNPSASSDLPLRDDSSQTSIKDTKIDLGGHNAETGQSSFPEMDTIKAGARGREEGNDDSTQDFSRPALSDPADINNNRRTQDWKFPVMVPPASADPELSRFPPSYDVPRPTMTPGSGGRPALIHHPTEPLGGAFGGVNLASVQNNLDRMSMRESLIDLDMSLPDPLPPFTRPSTAHSDAGSVTSEPEQAALGNPFELERHASLYQPLPAEQNGHMGQANGGGMLGLQSSAGNYMNEYVTEASNFSASDAEAAPRYEPSSFSDSEYSAVPPPRLSSRSAFTGRIGGNQGCQGNQPYTMAHFPDLPPPPSAAALSGTASQEEMADEMRRIVGGLTGQLEAFRDVYDSPAVVQRRGSRRGNGLDDRRAP